MLYNVIITKFYKDRLKTESLVFIYADGHGLIATVH